MDLRGVDPRDIGVDWLVLLLRHGRYADATELQQRIEAERRKQYTHMSSDPKMDETKRVFSAYTGLACCVYAKLLRKGIDDEVNGDEEGVGGEGGGGAAADPAPWNKSVRFHLPNISEEVELEDQNFLRPLSPMMNQSQSRGKSIRREQKAEQLDELAVKSFEESIFSPTGGPWDAFVQPYIGALKRCGGGGGIEGQVRVFEALKKYRDAHPENPNAHRFLFQYLMKGYLISNSNSKGLELKKEEIDRTKKWFEKMEKDKRSLLRDSLESFNKLAPSDKNVAFRLVDVIFLEAASNENDGEGK